MVKVILNGCSGKMGSVISNLAETKFPNVEIVAGIDNNTKAQRSYPIFAKPEDCNVSYDVLLDFSKSWCFKKLSRIFKEN